MENEMSGDIVTLVDSEGTELLFEIVDVIPYEGREYAVLYPAGDELSESVEYTVLELVSGEGEGGEETLRGIDDERTLNAVFDIFKANAEKE